MKDQSTTIKGEQGEERVFSFDDSFWSHDGYEISNGLMVSHEEDSNFIDQD